LDDGSTDVRPDLAALGSAGVFDPALEEDGLPALVHAIDAIAVHSLAVGFSTWAQAMTLRYLLCGPPSLRAEYAESLRSGLRPGVTAMSAGLKQLAGHGEMPLIAQESDSGLHIGGSIKWASNVFDDAIIVLPARTRGGSTYVVVIEANSAGVTIAPPPALMALGATASTSLRLDGVDVPRTRLISADLAAFVRRVRPALLILQTAFCLGVGRAAVAGAEDVGAARSAPFAAELTALSEHLVTLRKRLFEFAAEPPADPAQLLRIRLDGATSAAAATRLESALVGGAAFTRASAPNRRFREAAFLSIVSPSEVQLRSELLGAR
jgi:alkylation response protein AidB-like acyl-CoA dehydrogenase